VVRRDTSGIVSARFPPAYGQVPAASKQPKAPEAATRAAQSAASKSSSASGPHAGKGAQQAAAPAAQTAPSPAAACSSMTSLMPSMILQNNPQVAAVHLDPKGRFRHIVQQPPTQVLVPIARQATGQPVSMPPPSPLPSGSSTGGGSTQAPIAPSTPSTVAPTEPETPASNRRLRSLNEILDAGDMLFVRGSGGYGLMDIGAAGGWLGHVMLVVEQPECWPRGSEKAAALHSVWPAEDPDEVWVVKAVESTRSVQGLSESYFALYAKPDSRRFTLIGELEFQRHEIVLSNEELDLWTVPKRIRRLLTEDIADSVLEAMKRDMGDWSWNTAVRAVLSRTRTNTFTAHEDDAESFMDEVQRDWNEDPICTSVIIIYWQRCLTLIAERHAQTVLDTHKGVKEFATFDSADTGEIAHRLIMRYMPLKATSTLPGTLLAALKKQGWSHLEKQPLTPLNAHGQPKELDQQAAAPSPAPAPAQMPHQQAPPGAQQNGGRIATDVPPKYCSCHDHSSKRTKVSYVQESCCNFCRNPVHTTYQQYFCCSSCSAQHNKCTICGADASTYVGSYIPPATQQGNRSSVPQVFEPFQPVTKRGDVPPAAPTMCITPAPQAQPAQQPAQQPPSNPPARTSAPPPSRPTPVRAPHGITIEAGAALPSPSPKTPTSPQSSPLSQRSRGQQAQQQPARSICKLAAPPSAVSAPGPMAERGRFCKLHDETGKRLKIFEIKPRSCNLCAQQVSAFYAEVYSCAGCSRRAEVCMICGNTADGKEGIGGSSFAPSPQPQGAVIIGSNPFGMCR